MSPGGSTSARHQSWNYLSRRQSYNSAEVVAFTSSGVIYLHLQACLGRNLGFRFRVLELHPISAKYGLVLRLKAIVEIRL
jgi:hypothetical protein